jgi:crotonobetainyl-CoA:carnitine CoA-transferase CaiB-like acyl-CoA transferase
VDLVGAADVLVENFRAGVLARMGFGWDRLHALNEGSSTARSAVSASTAR